MVDSVNCNYICIYSKDISGNYIALAQAVKRSKKGENFQENHFKDIDKNKRKKNKTSFPLETSAAARLGSIWNNQFSWNMHMIWLSPVQTWGKTRDCLILLQARMQPLHIRHSQGASAAWAGQKCPCGACGSSWHTQHRAGHAGWLPVLLYIPAVTLP